MTDAAMEVYGPKPLDPRETILGMPQHEFIEFAQTMLIVIPHRGSEGLQSGLSSNIGTWAQLGTCVAPIEDQFGGFIELTRGSIARRFVNLCLDNPKLDKLIMIDSDENMGWEAPYKLALWDKPIVSGVVCTYNPKRGIYACFTVKDKYGTPRFPSVKNTHVIPKRGLKKVWNVGTGLICIKRAVLEQIFESGETPFYVPEEMRRAAVPSGILKYGEDMAFSQQCEKLGFDRYVDFSVHAVHFKTTAVCWPQHEDYLSDIDPEDWQVDVKDYFHG